MEGIGRVRGGKRVFGIYSGWKKWDLVVVKWSGVDFSILWVYLVTVNGYREPVFDEKNFTYYYYL